MFANLPQAVQQEIIIYLETHNFPAAKQLYDQYKVSSPLKQPESEPIFNVYSEESN